MSYPDFPVKDYHDYESLIMLARVAQNQKDMEMLGFVLAIFCHACPWRKIVSERTVDLCAIQPDYFGYNPHFLLLFRPSFINADAQGEKYEAYKWLLFPAKLLTGDVVATLVHESYLQASTAITQVTSGEVDQFRKDYPRGNLNVGFLHSERQNEILKENRESVDWNSFAKILSQPLADACVERFTARQMHEEISYAR